MNFRYLPLLAVAFVFGCSKPASTGNTASNTTDSKPAVTTTSDSGGTMGSTTASTTGASGSSSTTGTTGTPATPPKNSASPGTAGTPGSKTTPGAPPAGAPAGTPAGPGATAGAPPQMTPEQQKQMQDQIAKRKAAMEANAKKAEAATKSTIDGVKGTYHSFVDEAKIPAQAKTQPGFKEQLAKLKSMTIVIANDGSVTLKGFGQGADAKDVSGITSKVDGKPAFVLTNPAPQAGQPAKQYVELKVTDSGGTIQFGPFVFKR